MEGGGACTRRVHVFSKAIDVEQGEKKWKVPPVRVYTTDISIVPWLPSIPSHLRRRPYQHIQTTHLPKNQISWGSREPQDIDLCAAWLDQAIVLYEPSVPSGFTLHGKYMSLIPSL